MSVVIIGGGVIGLSIAYYTSLASPDRRIIIVDSEDELLRSASGFSGGYIVRDWFAPEVLPLAELSFQLHRDLAARHDGRHQWGYSESIAYSLVLQSADADGKATRGEDWLLHGTSRADVAKKYITVESLSPSSSAQRDGGDQDPLLRTDGSPVWANVPTRGTLEKISSPSGCAQVEPRQLCEWLIAQCRRRGVEFCLGVWPAGVSRNARGQIQGLRVVRDHEKGTTTNTTTIPCKDIVISAGCWTPRVFATLMGRRMTPGIRPLPGYSRVVRSPRFDRAIVARNAAGVPVEVSHAVFCPPTPQQWAFSPECMARFTRNGPPEIYVAGLNDETVRLPRRAGESVKLMEVEKRDALARVAVALTGAEGGAEDDLELVREALCFRPVSESGLPIIGGVEGTATADGGCVYVASGHGPWGITLSLGTGMVVSELLRGVQTSADLGSFGLVEESQTLRAHL